MSFIKNLIKVMSVGQKVSSIFILFSGSLFAISTIFKKNKAVQKVVKDVSIVGIGTILTIFGKIIKSTISKIK